MSAPFFDTNIVVDWLCGRSQAADELQRYPGHRLSRIVWAEVLAGEPPASRRKVEQLLSSFQVVEVDGQIARIAADVRHRGRIGMVDALILATARVHSAILVTRNTRDFPVTMPGIRVPYTL